MTWTVFLNFFLHSLSLLPSPVYCLCLHWSSIMSYLFTWACLPINLLVFLSIGMNSYCSWRMLSLKTCQLSCAPLPFRVASSHGHPPISSLNKPNFALLISMVCLLLTCHLLYLQDIELCYFMVTTSNTTIDYHIPDQFFLVCE